MRRRLRILVLTHASLVPTAATKRLGEKAILPWRTELHVIQGLRDLGHEVSVLGLHDALAPLHAAIDEQRPDVVFNLLMELRGSSRFEPHVVAALEERGVPYTGCNVEGLMLTNDKALTKKLLAWHGVPVPAFASFRRRRPVSADRAPPLPAIVKPIDGSGSKGISRASIVRSRAQLRRRVEYLFARLDCDVIAEEYIEGRELTVGVLGNDRLTALPVWETHFDRLPPGVPNIDTSALKWDPGYRRARGVHNDPAADLPGAVERRVQGLAKRAYRILRLSGFARIDFRLAPGGRPYAIDVNANPDIDFLEDFARAAAHANIPPPALLQRVLRLGIRYSEGIPSPAEHAGRDGRASDA